ncbi:hypothetical protein B0H19DRAFT_1235604 [Mycena capillaripes]|nr:hypothetical protein B0H19DRAFT_1235604 [Mycena capillaripes]
MTSGPAVFPCLPLSLRLVHAVKLDQVGRASHPRTSPHPWRGNANFALIFATVLAALHGVRGAASLSAFACTVLILKNIFHKSAYAPIKDGVGYTGIRGFVHKEASSLYGIDQGNPAPHTALVSTRPSILNSVVKAPRISNAMLNQATFDEPTWLPLG